MIQKLTEVFIGGGSALSANNTAINAIAVQLGIVGTDMTALDPAGNDTITTQPNIRFVNRYSDGSLKIGAQINGTSVTNYKGEHYAPSRRSVWSIGYQRGSVVDGTTTTAGGSITVSNSTEYSFRIRFKNDKSFFSERPETLYLTFVSSASASQSNIADQIVSAINNSSYGSQPSGIKVIKAVKIGDGTGVLGLTAASNYGVEIWGLTINQFNNTQYKEEIVNFSVHVDDSTGFGSGTTCAAIQLAKYGTGTYNDAYNAENYALNAEGVLNRTLWPIPTFTYLSSATYITSGNVAAAATSATGNISAVAVGDDTLTFATSTAGFRPGEIIDVNGVQYEIMYIISSTVVRIVDTATAIYAGGANIKVKYLYNVFNVSVQDITTQDGAGVAQVSPKSFKIYSPSIDASAADPFDRTLDSADTSAEGLTILAILNKWMDSTPLAPAHPTLA